MKDPIELIKEERLKQIAKGYDAGHDDEHRNGEISQAAGCYLSVASAQIRGASAKEFPVEVFLYGEGEFQWPWEEEFYRPDEFAIQNLAKAAALIVAEMERLQRTVTHPNWAQKKGWR